MEQLASLEESIASMTATDEAKIDPGVWIPIVLKLIELWLSRRGA